MAVAPSPPAVSLQSVASGLSSPLDIAHAGDGSGRLFIVQQGGQIRILKTGQLLPAPFLDIQSLISTGSERGLLGVAFHPNYAANGYFYVNYTRLSDGATVIARYQRSAANPDLADPASAQILLTIAQPYSNHNGGQLHFGPDGYLYIGTGDGGSASDPGNRAQDLGTLLGKILRIDVNGGLPYAIPASNPFQNDGNPNTLGEIWAYGLRNPWRFSFDRVDRRPFHRRCRPGRLGGDRLPACGHRCGRQLWLARHGRGSLHGTRRRPPVLRREPDSADPRIRA